MNHKLYGRLTFPETPTYGPCMYAPILVLMTHNNYKNWQWFIHTKRKVPWRRKRYQQIYYFHIWVACIWRNYQWKILILNWRRTHGWKSSNWSVPNVDHKEIADVWPISFYSHIRSMWTVPKKYVESGRHVLWCNVAMCAGFCCDIGQIDRFSIIELFPLSSCQVIILIARMTFNCSTSCLMS